MINTVHVVALGNPVMSDDGTGPRVLESLAKKSWPSGVFFYNTGAASLSSAELLTRKGRIIIVDALCSGRRPGTVSRLCASRLNLESVHSFSLHDLHLLHLAARFFPERLRDITVIGTEPQTLDPGLSLSPAVAATLPLMAQVAAVEIMRHDQSG